jgi:sulfur-oxidizing protein SoxB
MGGYVKRALGLNLYIKIENPSGQRTQELFVQGQPLKADQLYSAAFVMAQGVSEKYGISRRDLDIHAIEGLQHYQAKEKSVKADLQGIVTGI